MFWKMKRERDAGAICAIAGSLAGKEAPEPGDIWDRMRTGMDGGPPGKVLNVVQQTGQRYPYYANGRMMQGGSESKSSIVFRQGVRYLFPHARGAWIEGGSFEAMRGHGERYGWLGIYGAEGGSFCGHIELGKGPSTIKFTFRDAGDAYVKYILETAGRGAPGKLHFIGKGGALGLRHEGDAPLRMSATVLAKDRDGKMEDGADIEVTGTLQDAAQLIAAGGVAGKA